MSKPEHRYEPIVYWSDEDDAFIAAVPELPGCAADGATYAEAVANVEVAIGEWIDGGGAGPTGAGATGAAPFRMTFSR